LVVRIFQNFARLFLIDSNLLRKSQFRKVIKILLSIRKNRENSIISIYF
jgi:hypothetical protein